MPTRLFRCLLILLSLSLLACPAYAKSPKKPTKLAYANFAVKFRAGYYPTYPKVDYGKGAHAAQVKHGEYLVKIGDCISCHTDNKPGAKPFAGGLGITVQPFGTFYTPNITPDKIMGIGKWTDKQFIDAMHDGINAHGQNMFPVFPYIYFNRVNKKDLLAIKAYLSSIEPVHQKNRENDVHFPFDVRFFQYGWKLLFFYPHSGYFEPEPTQSKDWNRGAYLVEGLAHCSMCHTPINPLGAPLRDEYLSGNYVDGFWAPNITSAALKGYSIEDIVEVFKKGFLLGKQGEVAGPMAEANHNSLQYLSDPDLRAIAVYLKTVKGIEPAAARTGEVTPTAVRNIYQNTCADCHNKGIEGAPRLDDQGNWARRLKKGMPILVRHTIEGFNSMPPKGTCMTCTNKQIRAVVEYMVKRSVPGIGRARDEVVRTSPLPSRISMAEGKQLYEAHCASCHATGKDGAPKLGDLAAWKPIVAQGMIMVFDHAIKGYENHPPKGGCYFCSNAEIIAATKYMVQESKAKTDVHLW